MENQNLAGALVKAQLEIKNANLNKINPHFKSRYADLAEIRDCTIPILAKHGLAIMQLTAIEEEQVVLITRMIHESGESVDSVYPLNADPLKPQAMGSAMTYARRYCLAAICGISAEDDDDANAAEKNKRKATSTTAKPKAVSREPFEKMVSIIRDFTALDELDDYWNSADTDIRRKQLPVEWQTLLFVEFVSHGLKIAAPAERSSFKAAYSKPIGMLSDEQRMAIDDATGNANAA